MSDRKFHEQAAYDDLFFAAFFAAILAFECLENISAGEWLAFCGYLIPFVLCLFWFAVRIYHIRNKDELFGDNND